MTLIIDKLYLTVHNRLKSIHHYRFSKKSEISSQLSYNYSMKIFLIGLTLLANITFGATKNDPHVPISHCYHWIKEGSNKYLSFKYNYASEHENELTFYTTPASSNGSVAGPGLYCAKSPSGSYSYGDLSEIYRSNLP